LLAYKKDIYIKDIYEDTIIVIQIWKSLPDSVIDVHNNINTSFVYRVRFS